MDPAAVRAQRQEIRALSERYGIQTLCGSEVDILPDGSLDYDDAVLAELDIVIGSVHSAVRQSRDEMTARLIRACENPYVNIIGHPTGRRFASTGSHRLRVFPVTSSITMPSSRRRRGRARRWKSTDRRLGSTFRRRWHEEPEPLA